MSDEKELFERLRRSPWKTAWDDFILSGDDSSNTHVLKKHGWTWEDFISHGIEKGYIERVLDE